MIWCLASRDRRGQKFDDGFLGKLRYSFLVELIKAALLMAEADDPLELDIPFITSKIMVGFRTWEITPAVTYMPVDELHDVYKLQWETVEEAA